MQHESKVGLGLGSQYAGRGKTVVVDECRVIAAYPIDRIGRIGDNSIERLFIAIVGLYQCVAQSNVEFVVIDIMQKHVHPCQVVGSMVYFLTEEAFFNKMGVKLFFCLEQ